MKQPKLFVVAAGSGGHILPAICLVNQWKANNPTGLVYFFTGNGNLEKKIVKNRPYLDNLFYWGPTKFSRQQWWLIPWLMLQLIISFFKGLFYCIAHRPEKIVTTGGLLALPLCITAWIVRIPVEVYELNVVPGKAIKALFPFARTIHIVFPQTKPYCRWWKINFARKCVASPYPLRFTEQDKNLDKMTIINRINTILESRRIEDKFDTQRKTIFILGGSQGSLLLNNLIRKLLENNSNLAGNVQVIHQTGVFEETGWESFYSSHNVPALTFTYDDQVQQFYILSDVIVCRAGAGTMFEIAFFGKQCIVIPLIASTTNHQIYNAKAMAEQYPNLFTVLGQEQVNKNPEIFYKMVEKILIK